MLVAPSDIEAPVYTFSATGFTPIPFDKINFKTIVVASENDEWVSLERAKFFAAKWGSEFISIGNAGHINAASGYGQWQQGREILKMLGYLVFAVYICQELQRKKRFEFYFNNPLAQFNLAND